MSCRVPVMLAIRPLATQAKTERVAGQSCSAWARGLCYSEAPTDPPKNRAKFTNRWLLRRRVRQRSWPARCAFKNNQSPNSPNRSWTVGVLTCDKGCLGEARGRPRTALTNNVARPIGFTTFSKMKLLWLQCGARSTFHFAATGVLFFKML